MGSRTYAAEPGENRLLAALPRADHDRIVARTRDVTLKYGDTVYRPGGPIQYAYFPRSGILSVVATTNDGVTVEVGTIGREGFTGTPLLLGDAHSPMRTYCEVPPCHARRMDASAFREEVARGGPFDALVRRYSLFLLTASGQSTACNRLHSVEERLARWLLMTHDRVEADEFPLTQQVMSEMLGSTRPSVTVAAGILQKAGFIRYTRGRLTVLDRAGLEAAACECYAAIRAERERLLPPVGK